MERNQATPRAAFAGAIGVLLLAASLTVGVFVPAAIQVPFDFTVAKLFVQDGSQQAELQNVLERFEADEQDAFVLLMHEDGDWFAPDRLEALRDVQQRIEAIEIEPEHVPLTRSEGCQEADAHTTQVFSQVASISSAQVFRRRGDTVQLEPLRQDEGYGPAARSRNELLGNPLFSKRMISLDGKSALLMARIRCGLHLDAVRSIYLDKLRETTGQWLTQNPGIKTYFTGVPYIQNDIIQTMRYELKHRQHLVAIAMLACLWFAFRRFGYAALPFLSVALASIWWLGIMSLMGKSINIINHSTITIILVIGVGDAIHLVARVEEELEEGFAPWPALRRGWRAMLPAISLTTLTTVIGFASLNVAQVQMVRDYGHWAAVGIGLAWLFTLTVVPAVLLLSKPQPQSKKPNKARWLNHKALPTISTLVQRRAGWITAVSIALIALSGALATQLEPVSRALEEVHEDHPAQIALTALERELSGAMPFDLVFEGPRDQILAPKHLKRMAALQDRLDQSPAGVSTLSLVDLIGSFHHLWDQGEAGTRQTLPQTPAQVEALLALITLDDDTLLRPYLDDPAAEAEPVKAKTNNEAPPQEEDEFGLEDEEESAAPILQNLAKDRSIALRIRALKNDSGSAVFAREIAWIDAELAAWPEPIKTSFTGGSKLANQAVSSVVTDMMNSLMLAFGLITLIFIAVLRSFRLGLVAIIPNILPLIMTMGFMALAGVNLRISTVIIFAMCMGVVVDDTIHFLVRFRQERARGNFEEAIDATIRHAGRPVVFTTTMLALGFALLISSDFNGMYDFGRLSTLCILLALASDLLTLPALLILAKRIGTKGSP